MDRGERAGGVGLGERPDAPRPSLGLPDAIALVLGIVVGAGIFRAPATVASNAPAATLVLGAWIAGGLVSLAGALCYAELAAAYPHAGGDYHFLLRAFGRPTAFLFAWARLTVIPTGSVALLGFVFGDYAAELVGAPGASAPLAAAMIVALTVANVAGLRVARSIQNVLAVALVAGLVLVIATGLSVAPAARLPAADAGHSSLGLAMVFVLLAYGGWNEAAYVSTELRGGRRTIAAALAASLALVTVLYVLVNAAYLNALGVEGVRRSGAVAAEVLGLGLGRAGSRVIAVVVLAAVVTSANATLLMGSRLVWAFARDHALFAALSGWSGRAAAPVGAVVAQGSIALALVAFGALSRRGFEDMVAYTAPVFWLFFLLTGISLFVLRRRDAAAPRPFRVPLYPLTPAVFCASSAFLLWSSVAYAGRGAALGLAVLAAGLVPMSVSLRRATARRVPVP